MTTDRADDLADKREFRAALSATGPADGLRETAQLLETYIIRAGDPPMGTPTWQDAAAALDRLLAALRAAPGLDVDVLAEALSEAWPAEMQLVDDSAVWREFAPLVVAEYARILAARSPADTEDGLTDVHRQGGHAGATNPWCPLCNPPADTEGRR